MRKNNKGFTLIEVLVAITIMGIITVMALPGVQQLQSRNRERKYEKYGESLVSSAKLYVDSNEEDIFGYAVYGCADITFSELEAKALAKDYETNGITCVGNMTNADLRDDTIIHVEKKNNKYIYQPYITCTDKTGKIVYQTPDVVNRCENVSVGVQGNMTFNITAASDTERDKWTMTKQINVEIGSDAGLVPNNFSAYCLTKADNPDVCVEGSRQKIIFGNALGVKSVKKTINLTDLTGEFYFVLLASEGHIEDLAGNQILKNKRSNFTIKIDNTPPTITNITKAAPLFWGDLLYRLQVEFYNEPAGSKITRVTYTYDTGVEKDDECPNLAYHGDCTDIKSPYITTAFTKNRNVDVVMKVYDEAGNSASYKTHVD